MSLQTRLEALVSAIGTDVKALQAANWSEQVINAAYTNSTVTGTDVNAGFAPAVNSRYLIEAVFSVTSAATTTGVQVGLLGPTTGVTAAVKIESAQSNISDMLSHVAINTYQPSTAGLTTPSLILLQAHIETAATVGTGNIRIAARSEIAGSAITVRPGSLFRWKKV